MYKTGIVLSGGGARGFSHLGVLQALNEFGIFPDVISGTSAGSVAGLFYADGYTPSEILKILGKNKRLDYLRLGIPKEGFLEMTGLRKIIETYIRAKTYEELKIPLYVTATDLTHGKIKYFHEGNILDTVIASCSIPVVFKPQIINGIYYVDGGVLDNLPIYPIEKKCKHLIGSYVNRVGKQESFNNLFSIAERSFSIGVSKEITAKGNRFDLFIQPIELGKFNILNPAKSTEIYEVGYRATLHALKSTDPARLGLHN